MAKTVSNKTIKEAEVIEDTTKVTQDVNEQENAQQQTKEAEPVKVSWKDTLDEKVAEYRPVAIKVGKVVLGIGAVVLTTAIVKKVFFKQGADVIDGELIDVVDQTLISDDYESLDSFSE